MRPPDYNFMALHAVGPLDARLDRNAKARCEINAPLAVLLADEMQAARPCIAPKVSPLSLEPPERFPLLVLLL